MLRSLKEKKVKVFWISAFDALLREHREMNAGLIEAHQQEMCVVPDNVEEATHLHVRRVYEKYGKQITKAAEALGVARNTVEVFVRRTY